jgi:MFS family permease
MRGTNSSSAGGWYSTVTAVALLDDHHWPGSALERRVTPGCPNVRTVTSSTPKWRLSLGFQAGALQAAWVGARVMIGYRALAMDADALGLGLVTAAFAVPAMMTALPAGRMADLFGGMKLIAAGIGVQLVDIGGAAMAHQFGWLLMSAFLIGLGQIGCAVGLQSFVAEKTRDGSTHDGFGLLTAAVSVVRLLGHWSLQLSPLRAGARAWQIRTRHWPWALRH